MIHFVPIHKDGWRFIAIFAVLATLLCAFSSWLGFIGIILTVWCIYFFRDPERIIPQRSGLIVSPADGKVVAIQAVSPFEDFDMGKVPRVRISIFLNIFDIHVNRIPLGGVILKKIYCPGRFLNASRDKASEHNERLALVIDIGDQQTLAVVQIAGLIARRIRCDVEENEAILTGQRFGIIRFGSRVDVYLPEGVQSLVSEGQRMIAGETVLADLLSYENDTRLGVTR